MITTTEGLQEFTESLGEPARIAVDTEADSMHCYFEKLCLIQISVPGRDELIDPLAGLDFSPLFRALERAEIVLHGADYDLRLLRRAGLENPGRVFDTMIAARLIGLTEFSLAALILRYFEVELVKGSQKANWARRPLSPAMEEYARNDTRYLLRLAGILEDELERLGRIEWFRQSCDRAVESASQVRERDPDALWRITGSSKLGGRSAAMLRELWRWRDDEARRADRPAFHIMQNDKLLESASMLEQNREVALPRMSPSRLRRFNAAVARVREMPEAEWPAPPKKGRPRPTPEMEAQVRDYRKKRDAIAAELGIDPSIIAPKSTLEGLVEDRAGVLARLMPWQRELLERAGI